MEKMTKRQKMAMVVEFVEGRIDTEDEVMVEALDALKAEIERLEAAAQRKRQPSEKDLAKKREAEELLERVISYLTDADCKGIKTPEIKEVIPGFESLSPQKIASIMKIGIDDGRIAKEYDKKRKVVYILQ